MNILCFNKFVSHIAKSKSKAPRLRVKLCPHNVGSESICTMLGLCSIHKKNFFIFFLTSKLLNELNITSYNFLTDFPSFLGSSRTSWKLPFAGYGLVMTVLAQAAFRNPVLEEISCRHLDFGHKSRSKRTCFGSSNWKVLQSAKRWCFL